MGNLESLFPRLLRLPLGRHQAPKGTSRPVTEQDHHEGSLPLWQRQLGQVSYRPLVLSTLGDGKPCLVGFLW